MNEIHGPGEIIAERYQIITLLGQGGMGSTYSAVDLNNNQRVALKVVSLKESQNWKVLELFEREAQVLSSLNHPFIPKYIDYFSLDTPTDRKFYLVQELVEGKSLSKLIESGWIATEEEVKNIAVQILEILSYIHQLNPPIIHRDIKPDNIIYREDGKVYLVDFGAVKAVYNKTIIGNNTIIGTYGYMPLEQFEGKTYGSSDLYSFGCTLLFILTHRSPADLPQNRMKIDFKSYVNISEPFANWLEKMVEPEVENRFKSAKEALKELNFSEIYSPYPTKQIKGSKIQLERTKDELKINIPTYLNNNLQSYMTGLFILLLFCVIFTAPFFFPKPNEAVRLMLYYIFMFLIGLWDIFCIFVTIRSLSWLLTGSFDLIMTPDYFQLKPKHFFSNKVIKGHPQELKIVNYYQSYCTVKYKKAKFNICGGGLLTKVEKQWIFEEITAFMKEQDWFTQNNIEEPRQLPIELFKSTENTYNERVKIIKNNQCLIINIDVGSKFLYNLLSLILLMGILTVCTFFIYLLILLILNFNVFISLMPLILFSTMFSPIFIYQLFKLPQMLKTSSLVMNKEETIIKSNYSFLFKQEVKLATNDIINITYNQSQFLIGEELKTHKFIDELKQKTICSSNLQQKDFELIYNTINDFLEEIRKNQE